MEGELRWLPVHAYTQSGDAELYDEVTEEQYHSIVGSRVLEDDFIEDDDGSGYVDNGENDWGNADNDEDESEDEDAFEGEDEEYRRGGWRTRDEAQGADN